MGWKVVVVFLLAWMELRAEQFRQPVVATEELKVCGSVVQVDFVEGPLDLPREKVLAWVRQSAESVAMYFGRFPVARARVLIVPVAGRKGVAQGTTWGQPMARTRMRLGEHATEEELKDDWVMTHEMVHMAFPELAENHHWLEEGMATYVEPIARVQRGGLTQDSVWADVVHDMPKGEPQTGEQGLDKTRTWASTYWGGALFYLMADVEIREKTRNKKGLQEALQAVVAAGNSIEVEMSPEDAFAIGDKAVGVSVLVPLYRKMANEHVEEDLATVWKKLGVKVDGRAVSYDDRAPDAAIRKAMFTPRPACAAQ